jgi:hypothetical protein
VTDFDAGPPVPEPLERIATALERTSVLLATISVTLADLTKTQKRLPPGRPDNPLRAPRSR